MTKQEAQKEAQRLLEEAYSLVSQTQNLTDEHRFSMDVNDPEEIALLEADVLDLAEEWVGSWC